MRRLAKLLLGALAVLLALLLGLSLSLGTGSGQAWLAARVVEQLDARLAGRFEVERVALRPDGLALTGVRIFEPGGGRVIDAEQLELSLAVSLAAFRQGTFHVRRARLVGPRVLVESPAGGGTPSLAAAFAPRHPAPPEEPREPARFLLIVDELKIVRGSLVVRQAGAAPTVALRELALTVGGRVEPDGLTATGEAAATVLAPVRGAAHLALQGSLGEGYRKLALASFSGGFGLSTVRLRGEADLATLESTVDELSAVLHPEDVRAIRPELRPGGVLTLSGHASYLAGKLATTFDLAGETGSGHVEGELNVALTPPAWRVRVQTTELDPRTLDDRLPAGSLTLAGQASGRGLSDSLNAEGELKVAPTTIAGIGVGPASARGAYDAGRIRLEELEATMPGGHATAEGLVGKGRANLRYTLQASDLELLLASISRVGTAFGAAPLELPPLAGSILATGKLDGELSAPHVSGRVQASALTIGSARLEGLSADVDVAGLPDRPRGEIRGTARKLESGATRLDALGVRLVLDGRRADGTVSASSRVGPMSATLVALLGPAYSWFEFEKLQLSWPGAKWTLLKTARLSVGPPLAIAGLSLAGDRGGKLDATGELGPAGLKLELVARDIDVTRLPRELVPEALGLAGKVDVDASLTGSLKRPRGTARVLVFGGSARGLDGLGIRADVELDGSRARGAATAVRGDTQTDVRFDAPFPFAPRAPVDVKLELVELDLAELKRLGQLEGALAGKLQATGHFTGSTAAPQGTITFRGTGLTGAGVEGLELEGELGVAERTARLRADARLGGASARVDLEAALALEALLQDPDGREERLLGAPLTGTVTLADADLAALSLHPTGKSLKLPSGLRGLVTMEAKLAGSVRRPRGTAAIEARGLSSGGAAPVDLDAQLHAAAEEVGVTLRSRLQGRPLLEGSAQLAGSPELLLVDGAWKTAALRLDLTAQELDLALLAAGAGVSTTLAGRVGGTVTGSGTLLSPVLVLEGRGVGVRVGDGRIGDVSLDATYEAQALTASAKLAAASGGSARVAAHLTADLGVDGLAAGSAGRLAGAPLDLELEARRLDIGFLTAFSRDLRQVEGRLDGDLKVKGALPAPALEGWLMLSGGRVSYTNFGDLRDIFAELSFSENRAEVKSLRATSTGTLSLKGAATRAQPGAPFELDLQLEAKRFAIVSSDLTRAYLDAEGRLTGALSGVQLDGALTLGEATVRLPNTPSKAIQELQDHEDFLVIRRGEGREVALRRAAAAAGTEKREPSALDEVELKLAIRSRKPMRIEGIDVDIPVRFDGFKVNYTRRKLALLGRIVADEGKLQVMSKRFEVQHARVLYTGNEPPGDPRLDVEAVHESSYAKVTVNVGGTVARPTTALRSNPPLSEAQIATLLATGRPELKRGGGGVGEGTGAASALGAIATTQLKKGIAAKLPVDVISFQAGEDDVFAGSTLEAGSYLNDRVYVGYSRTFNLEETDRRNTNEVRVEYQLAPQWTLEANYGDNSAGGVDVFWTRDF